LNENVAEEALSVGTVKMFADNEMKLIMPKEIQNAFDKGIPCSEAERYDRKNEKIYFIQ
jgi:hypothetical protein